MKKLFLFLVVALMALSAHSQTESEHMKFMGIPIDGTLDEFKSKLIAKGFVPDPGKKDVLYGTFAGCDDCTIVCNYNKTNNQMYAVVVYFHDPDDWQILSSRYYDLKNKLTQKYGEPVDQKEEFDDPDMAYDDNSKILQLMSKKAKYNTVFNYNYIGIIYLSIISSHTQCFVTLGYGDLINISKNDHDVMDDL